jgi:hypothetical protein
LKPKLWAAAARASSGTSAVAEMKAVLHDWANAVPNGTVPRLESSKLENSRPPAL